MQYSVYCVACVPNVYSFIYEDEELLYELCNAYCVSVHITGIIELATHSIVCCISLRRVKFLYIFDAKIL